MEPSQSELKPFVMSVVGSVLGGDEHSAFPKEGSALYKGAQEREGVRGWFTAQKSVLLSITPNHGTENFSALRHD